MYSAKSITDKQQTIFCLRNCYVNFLAEGPARTDDLVFQLNTFELDRETFKLQQQQLLLKLTEDRLATEYVNKLIFEPLDTAVQVADGDLAAATMEFNAAQQQFKDGKITEAGLKAAEARVAERRIILEKAKIDREQKEVEINSQRRRVRAERQDLEERIMLDQKIREIHEYRMPFSGTIEVHSYSAAFLEKGDPICTILG
jgi:hypothetical protein